MKRVYFHIKSEVKSDAKDLSIYEDEKQVEFIAVRDHEAICHHELRLE